MTWELPDEHAWQQWRRQGIGGSDIAALLGLSRYASPYSLWAEKVGLVTPAPETQRQKVGKYLETALSRLFTSETGLYVAGEQTWCTHIHDHWARCTADGFAVQSPASNILDALGCVEFKTDGRFGWDEIPATYQAQTQWQMYVTGQERAYVAVMFAGFRFQVFELARNDDDIEFMVAEAERFWTKHVLTGVPPEVDGSEATTDALLAAYPEHQAQKTVELDPELLALWADAREAHARAKKSVEELSNRIRVALGDAELGTIGGRPQVTYRTQSRKEFTVAASSTRVLRPVTAKGDR